MDGSRSTEQRARTFCPFRLHESEFPFPVYRSVRQSSLFCSVGSQHTQFTVVLSLSDPDRKLVFLFKLKRSRMFCSLSSLFRRCLFHTGGSRRTYRVSNSNFYVSFRNNVSMSFHSILFEDFIIFSKTKKKREFQTVISN